MSIKMFAGYGWSARESRQVSWSSIGGEINELWQIKDGSWQYRNLTKHLGAPLANVEPISAFEWPACQTKQIVYVGADDRIHELWVSANADWSHAALTAQTSAPNVAGNTAISAYSYANLPSKQVAFQGEDGNIHELWVAPNGQWVHADLTTLAKAPKPLGEVQLHAYDWPARGSKQVVYINQGAVHELCCQNGVWTYANLSAMTGAPFASGINVVGYAWNGGKSKQVVYVGPQNHVHELWVTLGGAWSHADLTDLCKAPPVTDSLYSLVRAFGWDAGQSKQVLYLATGAIHELSVAKGGAWKHSVLPTPAPPNTLPFGFEWAYNQNKVVVYATEDQHVHQLARSTTSGWTDLDLTLKAGAPI